jgi:hypothetical protein
MRIDHLVGEVIHHLVGRAIYVIVAALAVAVFAVVAVYHFTIAGLIALEGQVGVLDARLIVAAIYGALAMVALIMLWVKARKPARAGIGPAPAALSNGRELQLVMLVEAVMLGYALARKRG